MCLSLFPDHACFSKLKSSTESKMIKWRKPVEGRKVGGESHGCCPQGVVGRKRRKKHERKKWENLDASLGQTGRRRKWEFIGCPTQDSNLIFLFFLMSTGKKIFSGSCPSCIFFSSGGVSCSLLCSPPTPLSCCCS